MPLPRRRTAAASFTALLALAFLAALSPAPSHAAISDVFGGAVSCDTQSDGTRYCGSDTPRSTVKTFDGVPLDVNAAFPPAPASGADGEYPLVMLFHGYGGRKIGFGRMQDYTDRGYAVFSMTDRGFRESCGSAASRAADPSGCANGYVRLIDNRYEVRDAQYLSGILADEGLVDPDRIGATGGSYGGGLSLQLAALRNRMVMPDGSLVPWESPGGIPMELAAAVPVIGWSDLAYSLVPNGSTLDYVTESPYTGRFGVMKESLVNGLYFSGLGAPGFYAPEGSDPSADLTGWRNRLLAGEPYDGDPVSQEILDEITTNHSAYYIDNSVAPAPLLLANGFTDDLFPVDEIVRYYNRTMADHPDAKVKLFAAEIAGHPRSQNKDDVQEALERRTGRWLDHFVLGEGDEPNTKAEAYTQTCPDDAASGGPFKAKNWARLAKGEVSLRDNARQTAQPGGGSNEVAEAFNPVSGGGACVETDGADQPGTANYRTEPAPAGGFTLLGSPLAIAEFDFDDDNSQVAARLLDVAPDGMQTLVARGLWRPEPGEDGRQAFQLHPNAWKFEEGHVAKLELLAADADDGFLGPYGRPSDGQQPVRISDLALRLPVAERPGAADGFIGATTSKPLPDGAELAQGFERLLKPRARLAGGPLKRRDGELRANVRCPEFFDACSGGEVVLRTRGNERFKVASGEFELSGGATAKVGLELTSRARRALSRKGSLRTRAKTSTEERRGIAKQNRRARG